MRVYVGHLHWYGEDHDCTDIVVGTTEEAVQRTFLEDNAHIWEEAGAEAPTWDQFVAMFVDSECYCTIIPQEVVTD